MMTEKEWLHGKAPISRPAEGERTVPQSSLTLRAKWFVGNVLAPIAITLLVLALCSCDGFGEVYRVKISNGSQGSAVCIGTRTFVSAQHMFPRTPGTSAKVYDASGRGYYVRRLKRDPSEDLVSFEIDEYAPFNPTGLVDDVPEGVDATLCGYAPDRNDFCFRVSVHGDELRGANNQHSLPGDSGGGVFVQTKRGKCLAGVHFGYQCGYTGPGRCETIMVPSRKICRFLKTQYGSCPTCPVFTTPQPLPRPMPQPIAQRPPVNRPSDVSNACRVEVDYNRLADEIFAKYGDRMRGAQGDPGINGVDGQSPQLDVDQLADVITSRYADRIRGPQGLRGGQGPQGDPGLVGVPSSDDIRNWLVGASSDPETRAMLATIFADLVASDPRTADLIARLEQLENRPTQSVDLTAVTQRLDNLERPRRFLIVDGERILDDERFGPDQPFVLDVQKIIREQ